VAKNVRKVKKRDENAPVDVQQAVMDYLASSEVKRLAEETVESYTRKLNTFARWCAETQTMLDDITNKVIDTYLDYWRTHHKPCKKDGRNAVAESTVAAQVRAIKTFLNWCLLDEQYTEHMRSVIIQRIKQPKHVEPLIETFTTEQIEALFAACDKEKSEHLRIRDKAILSLLLDSGIRASELCGLSIGNVCLDPKDAYIKVFGKGQQWGEVGIGENARRAIQKYIRTWREPTVEYEFEQKKLNLSPRQEAQAKRQAIQQAPLFVGRSGDPFKRNGLLQLIWRLGDWAEIEGLRYSPHVFRHTFSKLFMQNNGDIYKLSKLLRHSSVSVTERYLKSLQQSEARKGVKSALDNL
jgi:integrase/recombinase XerD